MENGSCVSRGKCKTVHLIIPNINGQLNYLQLSPPAPAHAPFHYDHEYDDGVNESNIVSF